MQEWQNHSDILMSFAHNGGETQLVLFDRSNSTCSIDVKSDGSALEEKASWGC